MPFSVPPPIAPARPSPAALAVPNLRAASGGGPCGVCPFSWCEAPWSSGRTSCPACTGRGD